MQKAGSTMKVAVVGSRNAKGCDVNFILEHLPINASEIVSGGAKGIDALAKQASERLGIAYTEFLPDYAKKKKKTAPLARNDRIVDYADYVLVFWDGSSHGSRYTMQRCIQTNKPFKMIPIE